MTVAPALPLARFQLEFTAEQTPRLPEFPGSAWRGAMGRALKRTVCVTRGGDCPSCLLYRACVYPYIWETPPPPDSAKMRRYTAAPHPFALNLSVPEQAEDTMAGRYVLGITLFGRAATHLPYLVHAFRLAGEDGIGARRTPFRLHAVRQAIEPEGEWEQIWQPGATLSALPVQTPIPPPLPARCVLQLRTPLRLKREDRNVGPAEFCFADLFGNVLRRISLLSYFHTDTPLETDFAALTRQARDVPLYDAHLRWYDWTRYSSRQDTTMQMGGLLGSFALEGADLEAFWSYLWLGQWTHAGKAATMGMGQYRIDAASLPVVTQP
jgi:hypothetical protein